MEFKSCFFDGKNVLQRMHFMLKNKAIFILDLNVSRFIAKLT